MRDVKPENYPRHEYKEKELGPTYCPECEAVHWNKHWFFDQSRLAEFRAQGVKPQMCSGCDMKAKGLHQGQLSLYWTQLSEDEVSKTDLLGLINNEVSKENRRTPLAQVVSLEDRGAEIEILTTTSYLATLLGNAVHKAFKGKVVADRTPREEFVRVYWERRDG